MIRTIITILFLSALTYGQTNLVKVPASECGGSDGAARLVGYAGTRTAGDTITGSYEASRSAFLFSVTTTGRYKLEYDEDGATGGLSYSENTSWTGTYGRFLIGVNDITASLTFADTADTDGDGKIEGTAIDNNTLDSTHIISGGIEASDLSSGSVTTAKIAGSAVTSAKIADGTIVSADLADNAVTTAKINDAAIGTAKIATGGVNSDDILDATIATGDYGDSTITGGKLSTALWNQINAAGGGNITNNADGTSITVSGSDLSVNPSWIDTTDISTTIYRPEDNSNSITATVDAIGGLDRTIMIADSFNLGGNDTIPANVDLWFTSRGKIYGNSSDTLWIASSKQILAANQKIFQNIQPIFLDSSNSEVTVQWFGATGDSVESTTSILRAINSRANLYFPPGKYLHKSTITNITGQGIVGAGKNRTKIYTDNSNKIVRPGNGSEYRDFTMYGLNGNSLFTIANGQKPLHFENVDLIISDTSDARVIDTQGGGKTTFINVGLYNDNPFVSTANSAYGGFDLATPDTIYVYDSYWKAYNYVYGGGASGYAEFYNTTLEQTNTASGAPLNQYDNTQVRFVGGQIISAFQTISHDPPVTQYISTRIIGSKIISNGDFVYKSEANNWPDSIFIEGSEIRLRDKLDSGGVPRTGFSVDSTVLTIRDTRIIYEGTNSASSRMYGIRGFGDSELYLDNVYMRNAGILTSENAMIQANRVDVFDGIGDTTNTILLEIANCDSGSYFRYCSFVSADTAAGSDGFFVQVELNDGRLPFEYCKFYTRRGWLSSLDIQDSVAFRNCDFDLDGRLFLNSGTGARTVDVLFANNYFKTSYSQLIAGDGASYNSVGLYNNTFDASHTTTASVTLNTGNPYLQTNVTTSATAEPFHPYDAETVALFLAEVGVDTSNVDSVDKWNNYAALADSATQTGIDRPQYTDSDSSLTFDGTNAYLTIASPADNVDPGFKDFTLEALIYDTDYSASQYLLSKRVDSNNRYYLRTTANNLNFFCVVNSTTIVNVATSGGVLTNSTWTYLALTFDRDGTVTGYINGQSVAMSVTTLTDGTIDLAAALGIGARGSDGAVAFGGKISMVRISHKVRTLTEITKMYNYLQTEYPL